MQEDWYVYILECRDGKLYVGIAKDVQERVNLHNKGLACRFTKFRNPVKLLYKEFHVSKSLARRREIELKGFSRVKKLEVILKGFSAAKILL